MKKQEKKFVLAGFALLAITGLLALAGCKNDSVPEPTRYTVKFETAHGTAPADITVVSGTELTAEQLKGLADTADYIFEGWYDGETKAEGGTYTVTKDVTLVAKWRDRGTVDTVTFTPPTDTKFYLGESIEVSLTSEEGATIQYHLGDGSWKDYDAGGKIQVTGDTTITARAAKEGLKPSAVTTATYTVRKLEGITVTTLPAQTVYSVGQEFDSTGMVVTATYEGGTTRTVTGTITTDTNTLTKSAGVQTVTVRYSEGGIEVSGQFEIRVLPKKLTNYTSPNHTGSEWTYVEFGEWPQNEAPGVSPTLVDPQPENLFKGKYYSDANGEYVKEGDKYYKVEPIVWRVLTEDYKDPYGKSTGKALLLAEKILTSGIKWADSSNNYKESYIRQWLNGNSGTGETSDYNGAAGFLQTAFTADAQSLIADTTVDNSAASTNPASNSNQWNGGNNPHVCGNTTDKVFLLSTEEATTGAHLKGITDEDYGFDEYDRWVGDKYDTTTSTRIRVTTDYAKATGAYQGDPSAGYGCWWWLRSPYYDNVLGARAVDNVDGYANNNLIVDSDGGVVPALSISLK